MPELPEVEVVKRSLKRGIINLSIKKVIIKTNKLRYILDKNKFRLIKNKKITEIRRRSKYIIIFFSSNLSMLIHLGMTGKFFFRKKNVSFNLSFYHNNQKEKKHDHVIFIFNNNLRLIFNDVRKFGFIKIFQKSNVYESSHIKNIGPEPLSKNFTAKYFKNFIKNKNRSIKDLLMDQKFVAGLGNIYVNEILFASGVNPFKKINKLKNYDIFKILSNTKSILKKSIQLGGSSIRDFINISGSKGNFQVDNFKVYSRSGLHCYRCNDKSVIKRNRIANRSSFYCEKCQK